MSSPNSCCAPRPVAPTVPMLSSKPAPGLMKLQGEPLTPMVKTLMPLDALKFYSNQYESVRNSRQERMTPRLERWSRNLQNIDPDKAFNAGSQYLEKVFGKTGHQSILNAVQGRPQQLSENLGKHTEKLGNLEKTLPVTVRKEYGHVVAQVITDILGNVKRLLHKLQSYLMLAIALPSRGPMLAQKAADRLQNLARHAAGMTFSNYSKVQKPHMPFYKAQSTLLLTAGDKAAEVITHAAKRLWPA